MRSRTISFLRSKIRTTSNSTLEPQSASKTKIWNNLHRNLNKLICKQTAKPTNWILLKRCSLQPIARAPSPVTNFCFVAATPSKASTRKCNKSVTPSTNSKLNSTIYKTTPTNCSSKISSWTIKPRVWMMSGSNCRITLGMLMNA